MDVWLNNLLDKYALPARQSSRISTSETLVGPLGQLQALVTGMPSFKLNFYASLNYTSDCGGGCFRCSATAYRLGTCGVNNNEGGVTGSSPLAVWGSKW